MYSLRKSRKILEESYGWYKKRGRELTEEELAAFESNLQAGDEAYLQGNIQEADRQARKLENFNKNHFKKSPIGYALEFFAALLIALFVATIIRQMWFELYEIPTGSMRPTFLEQDHLTVSKAQFGLNIPLHTDHFYFDPKLVERTGIVIWSGDGVSLRDTDSTYFGLVPYKKRYIKRLIGKPGDFLYFYGGKIYGIDKDDKPIEELVKSPWMEKLEHIPFLTFEGEITTPGHNTIQFEQMHTPIGRLVLNKNKEWEGEVFNGHDWSKDQPLMQKNHHNHIKTYTDFWGIRNFAMARLLNKNELKTQTGIDTTGLEDGVLYLEIIHNPSLTYPKPVFHRNNAIAGLTLTPYASIIPLKEKHLKAIMDNMYTARFDVIDGRAIRYSNAGDSYVNAYSPYLPGVENGRYEFYYGKAYKIGWGGRRTLLADDHPLYRKDPANVQNLFNYGIDFNTVFEPTAENNYLYPHRYAYFRDGDLYLLGGPVLKKDDPILKNFLAREMKKELQSPENKPYIAFKDHGPPIKNGEYDVNFIKTFGLEIPPKQYLVLGDNHAMSADSRIFGFLPQENLQGVPDWIIWPEIKKPAQAYYPIFTFPRLIVWSLALIIGIGWFLHHRYKLSQPVFKRIKM